MKIIEIIEFHTTIQENIQTNHKIQNENQETHENPRIPLDKQENH